MSRKGVSVDALLSQPKAGPALRSTFASAQTTAADGGKSDADRETAIRLLAREPSTLQTDVALLASLLASPSEASKD